MITYIENTETILALYENTIKYSGGGKSGLLHPGYMESALELIKNDDFYPNFEDKLTHLFWSFNKNHIFQDGNKRMAIAVSMNFLINNGYISMTSRFISQMEIITYHVAAGNIDKELLHRLITSFLFKDEYSEDLKLELLNAVSKGLD
ncbi:MAG: Fic family protein [Chlorobi bacterium]|nr:Fic family protein [Chlorobiota bacterium]